MEEANGKKFKTNQIVTLTKEDMPLTRENGYGIFLWESGNVYKGNYKDDERDGFGEMFWTDGSIILRRMEERHIAWLWKNGIPRHDCQRGYF